MAVLNTPLGTTLRLIVEADYDTQGNPILKNRNYSNIKPTATDQDVFDIANLLAGLQKHTLSAIQRIDEADLENEA